VDLSDLDIHELGERVKALYGDDVYDATLARALAIATRNSVPSTADANAPGADAPAEVELPQGALTTDAVVAALRIEFLKLLRPN
jgi:hypothetical protein